MASVTSAPSSLVSVLGVDPPDLPKGSTYRLSPGQPTPGTPSLLRHSIAIAIGAGILTSFPSTTHFCLALGADSPCADERCARKPWAFGGEAFHPPYRYLCQHSHFRYLQHPLRDTFAGLRNAPLPRVKDTSAASVHGLSPVTSSAQDDSTSELLRFL